MVTPTEQAGHKQYHLEIHGRPPELSVMVAWSDLVTWAGHPTSHIISPRRARARERKTREVKSELIIWKNIFSCKKRSDVTPLIPSSREGTDKERDRSRKKRGERFHNELVPRGGQFLALTFSPGWSAASHSAATIYVVSIIGLPEFFAPISHHKERCCYSFFWC